MTPSRADRVQRADIFLETWNGVTAMLARLYARSSQISGADIQVLSSVNVEEYEADLLQSKQPLTLPCIVVAPFSFQPNFGSYNTHQMRSLGSRVQVDASREWWTVLRAAPVIATFQVMLVSDDVVTSLRMSERWMSNERWNFLLKFPEFQLRVKITADKQLSAPQRAPSTGGSPQFRLITNLMVETYAGHLWRVPAIRKVRLQEIFTGRDLGDVLDSEDIQDVEEISRDFVNVFPEPPEYEPQL